jgi:tRNA(Ile)-lysidine synthase
MTSLAARVLAAIRRRQLVEPGARVVAAVSGGADSVALAWILRELTDAGVLRLVAIAHLDHSLRGAESARDAAFCRDLAVELDVPFDVEAADVAALAKAHAQSIEEAGREARYAFFDRVRARASADVVATAHTRDDQAETVLMRLLRGAGTRGLAGIPPRRGRIVRPLLDLRRAELVAWLEGHARRWVEDSTNADRAITRNWIRHALLPQITARFGDGVIDVLARGADLARADDHILGEIAREVAPGIQQATDAVIELDVRALCVQPLAIRQRVVRGAMKQRGGRAPSAAHVAAVLRMAESGQPVRLRLGRRQLELSGAGRVLSIREARPEDGRPAPAWAYPLSIPGEIDVPEAAGRLTATPTTLSAVGGLGKVKRLPPGQAVAAGLEGPLVVRAWRPGDALQVLGLSGRKKVQDLFVDRKVPRERRHIVPVVAHPDGRIVWVAGHALGEPFRVSEATKSVVVLSFEPFLEATK